MIRPEAGHYILKTLHLYQEEFVAKSKDAFISDALVKELE